MRMLMIGGWTALYQKAKQAGLSLTVIKNKAAVKPDDLPLLEQLYTMPIDDPELPELASLLHRRTPFDCVISLNEAGLLNAALIKEQLQIAGNPLQPVLLTRDKQKMREHLLASGLPTIPYAPVATVEEVLRFAEQVGYPLILKPAMGAGSMQIHKIEAPEQVAGAFAAIGQAFPAMVILAEKYLQGPEISVECFSWNGEHTMIAVTDKSTTGAPYFVEIGHAVPSLLPEDTIRQIEALTLLFLTSIGHQLGPSHTEMIVTEEGPYLIESHTRAGGDFIYELAEYAYGVDMFALTFQGLAGQTPQVVKQPPRGAAIRYLTLPEGTVKHVNGVEAAQKLDGIMRCHVLLPAGQEIATFRDSTQRYGWILARGATLAAAEERITHALETIKIEME